MPVEWTRLSGETVEELVAVLLCREFTDAVLVRPSQGDGGLDVLVPVEGGHDVYQVKKFASNLTASQKAQITESLNRLENSKESNGVTVRSWSLTLPLDPTNQNRAWFEKLTEKVDYPCEWRGRIFVDGLAAKYPDVIDYYLHDGADRLARVVNTFTSAMGLQPKGDGAGLVTPGQLRDYLVSVRDLLDSDPHFRYEVCVGPFREVTHNDPGLIVAVSEKLPDSNDNAVTVRVFSRFAAALQVRPIPIHLTIKAEPGSELADRLTSFAKYGTPLATPLGSVDGSFELPGDLGGAFEGGALSVGPAAGAAGQVIRLATVDPQGGVEASIIVDMQPASAGLDRTGMSARGTDRGQTIDLQLLADLSAGTMSFHVSSRDLTGKRPVDILPALRFIRSLQPPNRLAVAPELGPVSSEPMDLGSCSDWIDEDVLENQIRVISVLAELQEWTTVQLVVPAADSIDSDALWWWTTAVRLFKGEAVPIGRWSATLCLHPDVEPPAGTFACASTMEASVRVGDQEVELGLAITHSPSVEVVEGSVRQHDDHFDVAIRTSADVKATMSLAAEG